MTDLLHDGIVSGSGAGRGVRAQVLVTVPALTLLDLRCPTLCQHWLRQHQGQGNCQGP